MLQRELRLVSTWKLSIFPCQVKPSFSKVTLYLSVYLDTFLYLLSMLGEKYCWLSFYVSFRTTWGYCLALSKACKLTGYFSLSPKEACKKYWNNAHNKRKISGFFFLNKTGCQQAVLMTILVHVCYKMNIVMLLLLRS